MTSQHTEFDSTHHLLTHLVSLDYGVDVLDVCGGEARTSRFAFRRRLIAFRAVTSCDPNDEDQQRAVEKYLRQDRPPVAIMAPACQPFGRWA
eukprot:4478976-Pyramimonas_sp.AAC.1